MGPACAVADVRDGAATIWTSTQKPYDSRGLRRRTARTAARQGAGDLDVRHRLLWPQRPGRRHRRRRRAVQASRPAGARAVHAPRRPRPGTRRAPPRSTAAAPGSMRPARSSPTRTSARRSRAPTRNTRESRAADVLAGHLLGLPLKPQQDFEIPVASYTFDHGRLGWEVVAPLMDRASPLRTHPSARSLRPADPVRHRNRSWTRWRPRPTPIRSISGCNI